MNAINRFSIFKNAGFDLFLIVLAYVISLPLQKELAFLAPITVTILIQPTRGKTYHLGIQRLMGTVVGSILAILLLSFIPPNPYWVVIFLTMLVSFFAGVASIGNTMHGYFFQLTGYTTAIVFMTTYGNHHDITEVGALRVIGSMIGIFVALLGLTLLKKESDRHTLLKRSLKVKQLLYKWVRSTIKEGVTDKNISIREDLFKRVNELDALSYYAASERFFFGSIRKHTLHLIGSVYTILSINRALVRKIASKPLEERSQLTEKDFPDLEKLFNKLENEPSAYSFRANINWKGARIALARTLIAGLVSGGIWLLLGVRAGSTFFLITIIHCCLLTTIHKPKERYIVIIKSLLIVFLVISAYLYFLGSAASPDFIHFLILLAPGFLLRFFPRYSQLGLPVNLFTLVLYSICVAYGAKLSSVVVLQEFAAFLGAIGFALLMTTFFFPQMAKERFNNEHNLLLKELRKITHLRNPLSPDWMMKMYTHIERMMFYAHEVRMDETEIMNEGLSVIDICVELLELRSRMAFMSSDIKNNITLVIESITNYNVDINFRCENLEKLAKELVEIDPGVARNIEVIVKKIRQNERLFTLALQRKSSKNT